MGGYGSTRWGYHQTATVTADCLSISVFFLKRRGLLGDRAAGSLNWSRDGKVTSTISYQSEADGLKLNYNLSRSTVMQPEFKFLPARECRGCGFHQRMDDWNKGDARRRMCFHATTLDHDGRRSIRPVEVAIGEALARRRDRPLP